MFMHLIETLVYIIISNTQNIVYMCMIFSMYQNAGIISLPYPIAVFGYALLEETRPRKEFWELIRKYTMCVLFFKFFMNMSFMEERLTGKTWDYFTSMIKLGTYQYESIFKNTLYMMPEICIISFIMLNDIKLKLLGLYHEIEQDIESVMEGIDRTLEKGDEEKVKQKKL